MDSKAVSEAISDQQWLEPVAEKLQNAVGAAYQAGGGAGKKVENALNGVWLGHTLHPALVELPIGAWGVSSILDVYEAATGKNNLADGADAALVIGLASSLGAVVTGLTQWYPLSDRAVKRVGVSHALLNASATALLAGSLIAKRKGNRPLGRLLGWLGFGVVGASAYLGGSLSYEHKVGVDHSPRGKELPGDFVPVLAASDLPESMPTRAAADGVSVLLVKENGTIHALGETCSHFGGPLAEGALKDGCISCPWHGSRFRLADGSVVDGPATFPQPVFETRVQDNQIEVRAPKSRSQNAA